MNTLEPSALIGDWMNARYEDWNTANGENAVTMPQIVLAAVFTDVVTSSQEPFS